MSASVLIVETALHCYCIHQAVWEPRIYELFSLPTVYEGSNSYVSPHNGDQSPRRSWHDRGAYIWWQLREEIHEPLLLGQGPALTVCISAMSVEVPNTTWIRDYNSKFPCQIRGNNSKFSEGVPNNKGFLNCLFCQIL